MNAPAIAAWYVAAFLVVCGLSHALHPQLWTRLFLDLLTRPYAGLVIGIPTLASGLLIVLAHPEWSWRPGVIVTVAGWGWLLKGTLYQLYPGLLQRIATPHVRRPGHFRWTGAVMAVIGGLLAASLLRA